MCSRKSLRGHKGRINCVLSIDDECLISACSSGSIIHWNNDTITCNAKVDGNVVYLAYGEGLVAALSTLGGVNTFSIKDGILSELEFINFGNNY